MIYLYTNTKTKIINRYYSIILLLWLLPITIAAQNIKPNEYGLSVVSDINSYNLLNEINCNKTLIDLESYIHNIVLDIKYATANNFLGEAVYNFPKAFARLPVALALKKIQNKLSEKNLGLKIFDAYRPFSATIKFYEKVLDTVYVASPWKGSKHNRGCAVDLTIIDLTTGIELNMGTDYDDLSDKAAHNYSELEQEVITNRNLLKELMTEHGFLVYPAEWWHYDFNGWEKYELLDISFEDLLD